MFDFGFDKMAVIGVVALIVIGPEKLPRVARTVGALLGKAQRYVADVKAEVNRSIELEELQKMKTQFETAARDVHQTVHEQFNDVRNTIEETMRPRDASVPASLEDAAAAMTAGAGARSDAWHASVQSVGYKAPRKNWRLKKAAVPVWYKQRAGVRTHAQSGAARVARFRPRRGGGAI